MQSINRRNISFNKETETNIQPKFSYITNNNELTYRNSQGTIDNNIAIQIINLVSDINNKIITKSIGNYIFYYSNNNCIGHTNNNNLTIFNQFVNYNKVRNINNIVDLLK